MEEIINQLIAVSEGLLLLGFTWFIWFVSGVANNLFSPKKWSWKRTGEDIIKTLLMVFATLAWVVAINLLDHYTASLGIDISELLDGVSVTGLITIICGGSGIYAYKGFRNIIKFFIKDHTVLEQILEEVKAPEEITAKQFAEVAEPAKELLTTIYNSINSQQEDPESITGEVLSKKETKQLAEMGAIPYYKLDVSTSQLACQNLLGKGFNEGWGLQCVAGFKEFMFSMFGRYVAAGGAASNYAYEPARSAVCKLGFTWYDSAEGLQDGDWGIWTNGLYGHVAMYYQGKWLGQNQGAADGNAGNAFNLMTLPMQGFAGYFRPNAYTKSSKNDTDKDRNEASVSPVSSTQKESFKKGDRVEVLNYVDVNGTKLMKLQKTPYLVFQVNNANRTAVLKSDDGDIYARMGFDNLRKV